MCCILLQPHTQKRESSTLIHSQILSWMGLSHPISRPRTECMALNHSIRGGKTKLVKFLRKKGHEIRCEGSTHCLIIYVLVQLSKSEPLFSAECMKYAHRHDYVKHQVQTVIEDQKPKPQCPQYAQYQIVDGRRTQQTVVCLDCTLEVSQSTYARRKRSFRQGFG